MIETKLGGVCVHLEGQHASHEGSSVDLGDGSSVRHGDSLQFLHWTDSGHHLPPTLGIVAPETHTHTHSERQFRRGCGPSTQAT